VEIARHRVERQMEGCTLSEREAYETALDRLERARLQARLRDRDRN
jgi:hypothetical protein